MWQIVKNVRSAALIGGFVLAALALSGCRDHVYRYGTAAPTPFAASFLVVGDNRSGDFVYEEIVAAMVSSLSFAKCLLNTGDMIPNAGNRKQWANFLEMTAPVAAIMPWYGVAGNHEVNSLASQQIYQETLNFPGNELYYSFDLLKSHFIMLDTEIPGQTASIAGEQLAWLKRDLQTHAPAEHLFVVTHRPLFPRGRYQGKDLGNAAELHRLFCQYGVEMVFSGHEHQFYLFRKDTVTYVVTGGGGAPTYRGGIGEGFHHFLLVELHAPEKIVLHVLDVHGKIIQTETITPTGPTSPP